ncbi:RNA 2',3'-cyclic phosphodiesterase [Thermofilum pendens]|uniref:RNA 2',3'-cyclic phosphodiesterase n=1 Tax=Thermofilum pendens (strain DSM 2475 / Hrk 5) TaxID=368408 RepID=A1RX48_THEPD|nr:RNA 2',3'-cyclic phosphodiesterase [Thermofilum pendens]ABL77778.1 2'-5' RNA ligase [Thermofilum pendens Hrk 5]
MTNLIRSFVAVKVSSPSVLQRVEALQSDLRDAGLSAKFVEKENLHITLRFLGEIPPHTLEEVRNRLAKLSYHRFKIVLKGVGGFPSLDRPRVLWIGVDEGSRELSELAELVRTSLKGVKLPEPDEEFHPHLTIARLKGPLSAGARRIIAGSADTVFGEQEVTSFSLYKSTLTPRGPIYDEIARYDLP